jgi:hypothetical protein
MHLRAKEILVKGTSFARLLILDGVVAIRAWEDSDVTENALKGILDILYSKSCAVTSGLRRLTPYLSLGRQLRAPPMLELMSNAFQRWYIEVGPGMVPLYQHRGGQRRWAARKR